MFVVFLVKLPQELLPRHSNRQAPVKIARDPPLWFRHKQASDS
jgi:hypothetical protein